MEIEDQGSYSTAITALGSRFKLTEVYLWDEGLKEIRRGSILPKHIIFKYDDDDVIEDDCRDRRINSNLDVHTTANGEALCDDVGVILEEDMELVQQMSTLGLPLSFQTNKDKNSGPKKVKRNIGIMSSCTQEKRQDERQQSAKLSEKENSHDEVKNNAERINLDGMILEGCVCDESFTNLPCNVGNKVGDFDKCMIKEQPQPTGVAESIDTTTYSRDDSCYCTGSFGEWTAIWDSYYMRNYFYNVQTHESTWHPPSGMEHLALDNITNESSADLVKKDADLTISSNDSDLTCKSSEGECATNGRSAQLISSFTANANESQVRNGDCFSLSHPSSMDIHELSLGLDVRMKQMPTNGICDSEITCTTCVDGTVAYLNTAESFTEMVNGVACDENLISQVYEEMEATAGEIEFEAVLAATKRQKKARKSRSKKKCLSNDKEQHFQCSVDSYYGGIGKYWRQRYLLFSRFDEGIKMDEEGWFSVTPETVARHQASRCGSGVIIECFAGAGGNAIQFAKMGRHVIAIDIDPKKIEYAKHNAAIYGVEDQIDFVIGDSFSLASKLEADTAFMAPPWGGPEYSKVQTYNMNMLQPHDGQFLFDTFKETASKIVMFLPKNVDLNQLAELCLSAGPLWSLEVEKNFLNDKLKGVTAYFCKASV